MRSNSSVVLMRPPPRVRNRGGTWPARGRSGAPSSSSVVRSQYARKLSPSLRESSQAATRSSHGLVELLGRHAPEDGPSDCRAAGRARRAAGRRRPAGASRPRRGRRPLQAEVADPVLPAGVRAAVEVEPQPGDLVAEPPLEVLDQARRGGSSSRRRRSCSAARPCSRSSRRAARFDVEREADLAESRRRPSSTLGDARDDEVLLAREPDVAAERLRQPGDGDHLVAARSDRGGRGPRRGGRGHVSSRATRCGRPARGRAARARSRRARSPAAARPRRACPRGRSRRP